MQLIHAFPTPGAPAASGIRVLLLSGRPAPLVARLTALGARVETCGELYTALSELLDDPQGTGLFVIDCDTIAHEGLEALRRALGVIPDTGRRPPVILISAQIQRQTFPEARLQPIELRAPLTAVSLKVGFEHALRDRIDAILI